MTTARWCALALLLVACDGSPGGGEADATAVDGGDLDATVDAPVDAPADVACAVTALVDLPPSGRFPDNVELAETPTGWIATHQDPENAWVAAISTSGQVTRDPTPISTGGRRGAYLAVNGDRALVAVGNSVQARNLDGSVAGPVVTFTGSRPNMRAQAVVAGPGDGFRVLRAAVVTPSMPDGDFESAEVEIAYHDRDGGFVSQGPRASILGYEFEGAIAHGGELLARYFELRSIGGGCNACSSSGLARFDAKGTLVAADLIPVEQGRAAVITALSVAGDQPYLSWELATTSLSIASGNLARSATDTVHTEGGRLTMVATGPRAGLIGRAAPQLDASTGWLQRFDDNAGFSLGPRCFLSIAPRKLRVHGTSVLVIGSGQPQLVTAP